MKGSIKVILPSGWLRILIG
jgi:hypothetical protein